MGSYITSSPQEKREMLEALGYAGTEALFDCVPERLKLKKLNIPEGRSELETRRELELLAEENIRFKDIYRGAGAYWHYIPSVVKSVAQKEEFLTAYTPYQAEISQGILQAIFEYQTMICGLTGMDASNASVYDGASAAAEAVAMCCDKKRGVALISETADPKTVETVRTYCFGSGIQLITIAQKSGKTDIGELKKLITPEVACVYIEQPNYFGIIEDCEEICGIAHSGGAKFIMGIEPVSAALIKSPGECGADIAVGEGQPLGLPLSFGGPYLGFMAATKEMTRKLPGRIVGETLDAEGRRGFTLTLQAREQHIRREKASSNICSNQALCALTAAAYMSAMGEKGMREAAELCYNKAHYLKDELLKIKGFSLKYDQEFFNEFLMTCPLPPDKLLVKLEQYGILGGLPVENGVLWCATEMNTKSGIDKLISLIKEEV